MNTKNELIELDEKDKRAIESLEVFKEKRGHYWKRDLTSLWLSGNYQKMGIDINLFADLQYIRNNNDIRRLVLKSTRKNLEPGFPRSPHRGKTKEEIQRKTSTT